MIKSLNIKVLIGFMLVVVFLILAGGYSIFQFIELNKSADILVDESYNSLSALKVMTESLENEDDAILLLILGKWEEGKAKLRKADSTFIEAFGKAERHTTIANKEIYLKNIAESYEIFKKNWNKPIVETERQGNIDWYFEAVHTHYITAVKDVDILTDLNEKNMYDEAKLIKNKSKRAIMPGIIAIVSAIVYLLMLNFFISKFIISPIKRISLSLKNYHFGTRSFDAKINSNDEIKTLEKSIRNLTDKISNKIDL